MKKEFDNKRFDELTEFMEKMDKSGDYIMVQVSALNPGKDGMELSILVTGREDGKVKIGFAEAEAILIISMLGNEVFRELITRAAKHFELYEEFKKTMKS